MGVKVNSPEKNGIDVGELLGIDPLGIKVTASLEEIVKLDADCVILTPDARSLTEGLDNHVISLLESGKNVISTVAYHNVTMGDSFAKDRATARRLQDTCLKGNSSLLGTGVHPSFMVECSAIWWVQRTSLLYARSK